MPAISWILVSRNWVSLLSQGFQTFYLYVFFLSIFLSNDSREFTRHRSLRANVTAPLAGPKPPYDSVAGIPKGSSCTLPNFLISTLSHSLTFHSPSPWAGKMVDYTTNVRPLASGDPI